MKNPSSKLTRIRLDLEEYDFEVEYLRGKENYVADALSRLTSDTKKPLTKLTINDLKSLNAENSTILKMTTRSSVKNNNSKNDSDSKIKQTIKEEPKIYDALRFNDVKKYARLLLSTSDCFIKHGKRTLANFKVNDLYINEKFDLGQFFQRLEKEAGRQGIKTLRMSPKEKIFEIMITSEFKKMGNKYLKHIRIALLPQVTIINGQNKKEIENLLEKYHNDPITGGHSGITRTIAKIKKYYYWNGMTKHITKFVKNCESCQKSKITRHVQPPSIITPTPVTAFDIVLVDTIGPLPRTIHGNEYAVTIICDLTKFLVTVPVPDKNAKTIAKAIINSFILIYGPMKKLISDMGTEYKNQILSEICSTLKIEKITSTAHHHQTLGTIERNHRTFNEYLRSYISVDKDDWDEWLTYYTYCYNTTPTIVHDYCPFELVFGKSPNQLENMTEIEPLYNVENYAKEAKYRLQIAHKRAKQLLENRKLSQKANIDKNVTNCKFQSGDKVLIRHEVGHKLDKKYNGPYEIIEMDERNNCLIKDPNNKHLKVHLEKLKSFFEEDSL